ncbi:hypothetical protein ODJ79_00660 [Actinoplanes sp. KI2]|uniref:hypothetical protein n=1 Tax=Actinoplanes sp. KI2 TaxID=2983315 RepID=UPI0021D577B0|nr:hypothetical protein [Actinoplanes sp. KI2]MCU7722217.1 hypothetical protein [Actinoplanes sp. KI2]
MNDRSYRFFREWVPTPESQLPEHLATSLPAYARGVFAPDGTLLWTEMFTRKGLVRIEYRSPMEALPGVPFDLRFPAGVLGDLQWSVLRRYDAHGELVGFTVQLQDGTERAVLEVSYDRGGGLEGTTKFGYDASGDLRYLFDYDHDGKLVDLYDRIEANSPRFEVILNQLVDRAFYTQGSTLPVAYSSEQADIPGTIVRHELDRPDPVLPLTGPR